MAKKQATEEQALYEFINYGKIVFAKLFTMWTSMFLLWTSTGVANEFFKSVMLITIPQLLYAYSIRAKNTLIAIGCLFIVGYNYIRIVFYRIPWHIRKNYVSRDRFRLFFND